MSAKLSDTFAAPRVYVGVRVKPSAPTNETPGKTSQYYAKGQFGAFEFDAVFDENASQGDVFKGSVAPLLGQVYQGLDTMVFAYGYPGTGKTYSLLGSPGDEGLVPRSVQDIFRYVSSLDRESVNIKVSYSALTVGKDSQLFDLLAPGSSPQTPGAQPASAVKDVRSAVVHTTLTQKTLYTPDDIYEVLKIGRVALSMAEATASTPQDVSGSRAKPWEDIHTHLCVTLEGRGPRPYSSRISFVELAPPEPRDDPAARASAGALRNKMVGFSSLQSVITALQVATAKARAGKALAHIPWRDSPLTRWLKEPLFSAASVLLLATVSSQVGSAPDCLATMHWASRLRPSNRAKGVIVTPVWDKGASIVSVAEPINREVQGDEPTFDYDGGSSYTSIEVTPYSSRNFDSSRAFEEPARSLSPPRTNVSPGRTRGDVSPGRLRLEDRDPVGDVRRSVEQTASKALSDRLVARSMEADMQAYSELMDVIRTSQGNVLRAQAVLQRFIEEHGQLRSALASEKSENDHLKRQISALSVTVDDQRNKIVDAEYLINSMRDEADRIAHDQNIALESAMGEIQAVKEALRRAEKERESLTSQAAEDKRRIEGLERRESKAVQELSETAKALGEAKDKLSSATGASEALRSEAQQLHLEISSLKAKVHERDEALVREQDRIREVRGSLEETKAALRVAESEVDRLKPKEQEVHDLRIELREAQSALLSLSAEKNRLKELGAKAEAEIERLSDQLERTLMEHEEAEAKMVADHQALVDRLRAEIGSANDLIANLQARTKKLEGELSDSRARADHLEAEGNVKSGRIAELEKKNEDLEGQLAAAKRTNEALEGMKDTLELQNDRQLREIESLAREKEDLISDLTVVNKKLASVTTEKQDLTVQLGAAQREGQRLTAKVKELQGDLEQETRVRVDTEAELEARLGELQRTAVDLATQKERVKELGEALEDATDRERKLNDQNRDLGSALNRAHADIKTLQDTCADRSETIARLKDEVGSLEARIERHLMDIDDLKEAKAEIGAQLAETKSRGEIERKGLEEKVRGHRRLMAEVCLMLGVQGVGVSSDYTAPDMHTHIINSVREVLSRASGMTTRGLELEAENAKLGELVDRYGRLEEQHHQVLRDLESARRQLASQEADAESELKMLRAKCSRLEREAEDAKGRSATAAEADALASKVSDLQLRNVGLETKLKLAQEEAAQLRAAQAAARGPAPGREDVEALKSKSRQVAELEGEVRAMREEVSRARELAQKQQTDALARKIEADSLRSALETERQRMRDLEAENQRLILSKDDMQRNRMELQTQLDSLRIESLSRDARTRARDGLPSPNAAHVSTARRSPGASAAGPLPSPLRQPNFAASTPATRNAFDPKGY